MPGDISSSIVEPIKAGFDPRTTKQLSFDHFHFILDESKDQPAYDPPLCSKCSGLPASPLVSSCCTKLLCCKCESVIDGKCPHCKKTDCLKRDLGSLEAVVRPFQMTCPCEHCDASFSLLSLITHLQRCPEAIYICGCGVTFSDEDCHYRDCQLTPVRCIHCPKCFNRRDIAEHVENTHPKCDFCHKYHAPSDQRHMPQPCPVDSCVDDVPPCFLREHLKEKHSEAILSENTALKGQLQSALEQLAAVKTLLETTMAEKRMLIADLSSTQREQLALLNSLHSSMLVKCAYCQTPVPHHQLEGHHKTDCERYAYSHFCERYDHMSPKMTLLDQDSAVRLTTAGDSVCLVSDAVQRGKVKWCLVCDPCKKHGDYVGVVAASTPFSKIKNRILGYNCPAISLGHSGNVCDGKGSSKSVYTSGLLSFKTGSMIYVTLDMDARTVTFQVDTNAPYTTPLKLEGPHVLGVSLNEAKDVWRILSCEIIS